MRHLSNRLLVIFAIAWVGGCANAPSTPTGTIEVRLLPGQSPVAEIDGPYAAYSRVGHGVLLRVWPASIRNGIVDISIVVRNTDLDAITLTLDDIEAHGASGPATVLGAGAMLARFDAESGQRDDSEATFGNLAAYSSSSTYDGNAYDGVISMQTAPGDSGSRRSRDLDGTAATPQERRAQVANWYLDDLHIEPGETATAGISLELPEQSETIILNVGIDREDHEFALVFERAR